MPASGLTRLIFLIFLVTGWHAIRAQTDFSASWEDFFVARMGFAYAEPLDNIKTEVSEFDGDSAIIEISWNHDELVSEYEIGCVSCSPNFSETTAKDSIILSNLTSIGDNSTVLLYLIAYDSENEIVDAKQIFVELD